MTTEVEIPQTDLVFKYSRSSGPGGQNVNKVSTKVTLFFSPANCTAFSDVQKNLIMQNLKGRIDQNGVIKITSQKHRTQNANRQAVVEKLKRLLAGLLVKKPVRKKTTIPQWAKQKRLESKRKQSSIKQLRAQQKFVF